MKETITPPVVEDFVVGRRMKLGSVIYEITQVDNKIADYKEVLSNGLLADNIFRDRFTTLMNPAVRAEMV